MTEPWYEIQDPGDRLRRFREAAPMAMRAELYKMLLQLRERPRLDGRGYRVVDVGGLLVARFSGGTAAMVFEIDVEQRRIVVVNVLLVSPNGESAKA